MHDLNQLVKKKKKHFYRFIFFREKFELLRFSTISDQPYLYGIKNFCVEAYEMNHSNCQNVLCVLAI